MSGQVIAIILEGVIAIVAVITLVILLIRGALSVESRLTRVETKIEPLWESLLKSVVPVLKEITPQGNPITPERWQYLLTGLENNTLTTSEATELKSAFLKQQQVARQNKDLASLLALGIGIAILASILGKK